MKKIIFSIVWIITFQIAYSQSNPTIQLYSSKLDTFIIEKKLQYGNALKDSIWNDLFVGFPNYIKGSKLDDFKFASIDKKTIDLQKIITPLFFQATASWCKPCVQEIPALNQLVEKYDGKVTFILVAHDTQEATIKLRKKLNPKIILISSAKEIDAMEIIKINISGFRHILPFPTTYFTTREHLIKEIFIGAPISDENKSTEQVDKLNIERNSAVLDKLIAIP